MLHSKYYFTVLILLWISVVLVAQQANPFEVQRNVTPQQTQTTPTNTGADTSNAAPVTNIIDTTSRLTTPLIKSEYENQNLSEIEERPAASTQRKTSTRTNVNPFDIDHIPIRKKDLVNKETEGSNILPTSPTVKADKNSDQNSKIKTVAKIKSSNKGIGFIIWIFIFSLLIVAVTINMKRRTFVNLYRAISNDNYLKLIQREETNGKSLFFLLLYTLFYLNMALFIFLIIRDKVDMSTFQLYAILLLAILAIYIVRHFVMSFISFIYPFAKENTQHNFTIAMFNVANGFVLLPINLLIAYSPWPRIAIIIGIIVVIFFYTIRQLRGVFISMRVVHFNLFHFFIYLCTLEIAPIMLLYRFITNYTSII